MSDMTLLVRGAVGNRRHVKAAGWGNAFQGLGGLASGASAYDNFNEGNYRDGASNTAMAGSMLGDLALKSYAPQIGKVIGTKGLSFAGKAVPFLGTAAYANDAMSAFRNGHWSSAIGNGAGALFNAFGLSPIALGLSSFGDVMEGIGKPSESAVQPTAPRYKMTPYELSQLQSGPPATPALNHLQGLIQNYFKA